MSSPRKKYGRQFKLEVVRRVQETGRSQAQVAKELGLSPNTLSRWMRQYGLRSRHYKRPRALTVARRAADRPFDESGVVDAGLCHGAAGVGHIFNRIGQAARDERCLDAAREWFGRCLAMRNEGEDTLGEFRAFCFERVAEGEYVADPCWMTGAAGVGLALLAANAEIKPEWDRGMLLEDSTQYQGI